MPSDRDFEETAARHYRDLYRFALSLARNEADACDLTQETFYLFATKGGQIRHAAKVKSWLFTTLHREFLQSRRRDTRFPHYEIEEAADELPLVELAIVDRLDAAKLLELLWSLDEHLQAPLALFYLEDMPYREIAEVLEIPLGTVQSRISRGKACLYRLLVGDNEAALKEKGAANG